MENRKIVCAAICGKNGFILLSVRHYDVGVHEFIKRYKEEDNFKSRSGNNQGFVDNFGTYHTRESAFKIALVAGQLEKMEPRLNHLLEHKQLFSEMLY